NRGLPEGRRPARHRRGQLRDDRGAEIGCEEPRGENGGRSSGQGRGRSRPGRALCGARSRMPGWWNDYEVDEHGDIAITDDIEAEVEGDRAEFCANPANAAEYPAQGGMASKGSASRATAQRAFNRVPHRGQSSLLITARSPPKISDGGPPSRAQERRSVLPR